MSARAGTARRPTRHRVRIAARIAPLRRRLTSLSCPSRRSGCKSLRGGPSRLVPEGNLLQQDEAEHRDGDQAGADLEEEREGAAGGGDQRRVALRLEQHGEIAARRQAAALGGERAE